MPRKPLIFFIIILLICAALIKQLSKPILKIEKIECRLENQSCPQELIDQLNSLKGESFLFTKLDYLASSSKLNFYQLKSFSKQWPNALKLEFVTNPSSYLLEIDNPDSVFLITENGLAQAAPAENFLPVIKVISWPNSITDQQIDPDLHQLIFSLINLLSSQQIEPNITIYHQNHIEISLKDNLFAIVGNDDINQQMAKLFIILEELDISNIDLEIKEIDLRFKFPVLRTNRTPSS